MGHALREPTPQLTPAWGAASCSGDSGLDERAPERVGAGRFPGAVRAPCGALGPASWLGRPAGGQPGPRSGHRTGCRRRRNRPSQGRDLGAAMLAQPVGQGGGVAAGQQVERLAALPVDEDGAVVVPAAGGEVIDTQHPGGGPRRDQTAMIARRRGVRITLACRAAAARRAPARPARQPRRPRGHGASRSPSRVPDPQPTDPLDERYDADRGRYRSTTAARSVRPPRVPTGVSASRR